MSYGLHELLRLLESAYADLHSYEGAPQKEGESFLMGMTTLDEAITEVRRMALAEDAAKLREAKC